MNRKEPHMNTHRPVAAFGIPAYVRGRANSLYIQRYGLPEHRVVVAK